MEVDGGIMRKAITLVEIIFTIIIASILIIGTASLLKNMAFMVQKSKSTTELSLDTQSALNQLSLMLSKRIPNSTIGYDGVNTYSFLRDIDFEAKVLEWLIEPINEEDKDSFGVYYPFVDLQGSNFSTKSIKSPASNFNALTNLIQPRYEANMQNSMAIIFAGGLDYGVGSSKHLGWHNGESDDIYKVNISSSSSDTLNINESLAKQPEFIYEKFFLAESGVAVARGENIDANAQCIQDLGISAKELKNALLVFDDFRPWLGQTYCADLGTKGLKSGKVSILSLNITSFEARDIDYTIRLSIMAKQRVRGELDEYVKVSKQKVVL